MRHIRAARSLCSLPARWTKRAAKELGGRDPAALLTKHTAEGIAVKPLYMSSDLPAPPPDGELQTAARRVRAMLSSAASCK